MRLKPAEMQVASSMMTAEPPCFACAISLQNVGPRHVGKSGMIATFEIDVGLLRDAVVEDGVDPIGFAKRRHSTGRTVRE